MRKNLGLKTGIDKNVLKSLKKGDLLWSAVYDHASGLTEPVAFQFKEYVKAPNNSKGIWARIVEVEAIDKDGSPTLATREHLNQDGDKTLVEDSKVNDISSGLFLDKRSALEGWQKVAEAIYKSACEAVESLDD